MILSSPAILRLIVFTALLWLIKSCNSDTKSVTFKVIPESLPDTSQVYVSGNDILLGEWNPAAVTLMKFPDGSWRKTFSFPAGTHLEYKFTRGSWHTEAVDSLGFVPSNYILNVEEDSTIIIRVAGWKDAHFQPAGQIRGTVRYHREMEGEGIKPRDVIVWMPPGYETEVQKRYPVLYMQDGQNIIDPGTSFLGNEWGIDEVADSLIRAGKMEEILIVGIYNTPDRKLEYSDTTAGHAYLNFLINTLKPFIDQNYRTLPDREHTAVMGSSMGGLISFLSAWYHPDIFYQAGCVSPAFLYQNYRSVRVVEEYRGPDKNLRIYMDNGAVGLEDTLTIGSERMLKALQQQGFRLNENLQWYFDETGDHSERAWGRRVWRPLLFMFGKD
jgi:predicted alpha/beta superfamily hydrolase